jgi:hypothetical protein
MKNRILKVYAFGLLGYFLAVIFFSVSISLLTKSFFPPDSATLIYILPSAIPGSLLGIFIGYVISKNKATYSYIVVISSAFFGYLSMWFFSFWAIQHWRVG